MHRATAWALLLLVTTASDRGAGATPDEAEGPLEAAAEHDDRRNRQGEADALAQIERGEDRWLIVEGYLLRGEIEKARDPRLVSAESNGADLATYASASQPARADLARSMALARTELANGKTGPALALPSNAARSGRTVTHVLVALTRAEALRQAGKVAAGQKEVDAALALAGTLGWRRGEVRALRQQLRGLPEDASRARRRTLERLVRIGRGASHPLTSAAECSQIGRILHEMGELDRARHYLLEAEGVFRGYAEGSSPGATKEVRKCFLALADIEAQRGNLARRLDLSQQALVLTTLHDIRGRGWANSQVAAALLDLGRWAEGDRIATRAFTQLESANPLDALLWRGDWLRTMVERGDFDRATEGYNELEKHELLRKLPAFLVVMALHRASALLDRGAADAGVEALAQVERAQTLLDDASFDTNTREEYLVSASLIEARALNAAGRHTEAEAVVRPLLVSRRVTAIADRVRHGSVELARALLKSPTGAADASKAALRALSVIEDSIDRLPQTIAMSVVGRKDARETIDMVVAAAAASGKAPVVLEALERTRALVFEDVALRRLEAHAGTRLSDELLDLERMSKQVASAARRYSKISVSGNAQEIQAAREALHEARMAIRRAVEEDARLRALNTAPSKGLREQTPPLPKGHALLYFATASGRCYAVLDWNGRGRVWNLGGTTEFASLVEALRASLVNAGHGRGLVLPSQGAGDEQSWKLARDVLMGKLPNVLLALMRDQDDKTRPRHVVVSASGMFATVPWELVLFDDDPDAKRPTVSAAASRMVLEYLRARAPRDTSTGPLLVGDPDYTTYTKSGEERVRAVYEGATLGRIEHSREEVAAIKALLEDRGANVLLGDQATLGNLRKELFKRVFRNVQVLHLACHGLVNRRAPWLSALALSAATDADDGLLTIDEISRWSFRGLSLVVLAACESGLGTPVPGEGDDGFVRAFHLAGARNVVGSLWKVSDASTKKLMVAFYKYMYEEKLTPAAALQRAKEDLRGDNSTAHPFHWAAWTVWGPGD